MPRRIRLTEKLITEIAGYVENGNTNKDACLLVGASESVFYLWIEKGTKTKAGELRRTKHNVMCELFYDEMIKALAKFRAFNLSVILNAALGEKDEDGKVKRAGTWTAAAWLLERKFPKEYGRHIHELSGPDGEPVESRVTIVLPSNGRK